MILSNDGTPPDERATETDYGMQHTRLLAALGALAVGIALGVAPRAANAASGCITLPTGQTAAVVADGAVHIPSGTTIDAGNACTFAIWLPLGAAFTLDNVTVQNGRQADIYVNAGATLILQDNSLIQDSAIGVQSVAGTIIVSDSTVQHNVEGISLGVNSSLIVRNKSVIARNSDDGVQSYTSNILSFGSTYSANGNDGIWLSSGALVSNYTDFITNNSGNGVEATFGANVTIKGGTIQSNHRDGLRMDAAGDVTVTNEHVLYNGYMGVALLNGTGQAILNHTTISFNGLWSHTAYGLDSNGVVMPIELQFVTIKYNRDGVHLATVTDAVDLTQHTAVCDNGAGQNFTPSNNMDGNYGYTVDTTSTLCPNGE